MANQIYPSAGSSVQCTVYNHSISLLHTYLSGSLSSLLWLPHVIGQAIVFLPCGFYLLSIYLFFISSPNLKGRRLDVYHTSTHGVALVRIYDAGLKCTACGSLKIQDAKNRQKFAIWAGHHHTTLSSQLRHTPTIRKNSLSSNIPPHVLRIW